MNRSIDTKILYKEMEFNNYIINLFKSNDEKRFLDDILKYTTPYIFGGVIKDFMFKIKNKHRDIDIVVEEIPPNFGVEMKKYISRINQFGGFKMEIGSKSIDLWQIDKTWAIRNNEPLNFTKLYEYLPSTSFFNITAIIYSLKELKFYYHNKFKNFLHSKTLDIVYQDNPFPELCIVKSYEFYRKFKLRLSSDLKEYIIVNYKLYKHAFKDMQVKHYGNVIYSDDDLYKFYYELLSPKRKKYIEHDKNQLIFKF